MASRLLFALLVFAWLYAPAVLAAAGTCDSGAAPFALGITQCPPGFYCPFADGSTQVESCTPTADCTKLRLSSQFCEPQGTHEGIVCTKGFYCPTQLQRLPCLEGHYCPTGTVNPIPCPPLSYCPVGSQRPRAFASLLSMLVIDAVIIAYFLWRYRVEVAHFFGSWKSGGVLRKPSIRIQEAVPDDFDTSLPNSPKLAKAGLATNEQSLLLHNAGPSVMNLNERNNESSVVEGFRRSREGKDVSLDFTFKNMSVVLPTGKKILSGVTGKISAGRVTAIMGPSGAGKTTFMNCLMGKIDGTSGELRINGEVQTMHQFKQVIGYVPQEDIMIRELSVIENLRHAARVRLPRRWTQKEKDDFADVITEVLSLTHVKNTLIGDENTRGISGGQRKRVNIGLEVAAAPLTLFLDEPTSGLDSTAALNIAHMLRDIAKLGITIVSVIHQPRSEIFECFDDILMLAPGGSTAYLGPQKDIVPYFQKLGYYFPPMTNPADALMDILSGKGERVDKNSYTVQSLVDAWYLHASELPSPTTDASSRHELVHVAADQAGIEINKTVQDMCSRRGDSFLYQMWLCHQRSLVQQERKVVSLVLELAVAALCGALMGLSTMPDPDLYLGIVIEPFTLLSPAPIFYLPPLFSLLMAMSVGIAGAPAGVKTFGEERTVYFREAAAGHNRAAYFVGKSLSVFYRLTVAALHFCCLFHVVAAPVLPFGPLMVSIWTLFVCVYGLSSCVSMLLPREDAPLLAVVSSLFAAVLSGYGPTMNNWYDWHLGWFLEMCYSRWTTEALFTSMVTPYSDVYDVQGSASVYGYTLNRFSTDIGYALLISMVLRLLAFLFMIFGNRQQQK